MLECDRSWLHAAGIHSSANTDDEHVIASNANVGSCLRLQRTETGVLACIVRR
jgi:hypothetical protein